MVKTVDERWGASTAEGMAIPLTGLLLKASLAGPFVRAELTQRWSNTGDEAVEALWHFPVPEGVAVRSLVVERGERRFEAEVRERDEASTYSTEPWSRAGGRPSLTPTRRACSPSASGTLVPASPSS